MRPLLDSQPCGLHCLWERLITLLTFSTLSVSSSRPTAKNCVCLAYSRLLTAGERVCVEPGRRDAPACCVGSSPWTDRLSPPATRVALGLSTGAVGREDTCPHSPKC